MFVCTRTKARGNKDSETKKGGFCFEGLQRLNISVTLLYVYKISNCARQRQHKEFSKEKTSRYDIAHIKNNLSHT